MFEYKLLFFGGILKKFKNHLDSEARDTVCRVSYIHTCLEMKRLTRFSKVKQMDLI